MSRIGSLVTIILTEVWTIIIALAWYDTFYRVHTQTETIENVFLASVGTLFMFCFWGLVWVSALKEDS